MGILRRMKSFWQAHYGSSHTEALTALEIRLAEIDEHLAAAHGELAYCESEERRFESLAIEEQHTAQHMWQVAQQALRQRKEELAREAIRRHLSAQLNAERYRWIITQHQQGIAKLADLLAQLKLQREEMRLQHKQLTFRRHLAHARRTITENLYGEHGRLPVEQAEESTRNDEYIADAYQQLAWKSSIFPPTETERALTDDMIETALLQLRGEIHHAAIEDETGGKE